MKRVSQCALNKRSALCANRNCARQLHALQSLRNELIAQLSFARPLYERLQTIARDFSRVELDRLRGGDARMRSVRNH